MADLVQQGLVADAGGAGGQGVGAEEGDVQRHIAIGRQLRLAEDGD